MPDISSPQLPRLTVKRKTPGVAQPHGIYFVTYIFVIAKRVIQGDVVSISWVLWMHIDPQNGSKQAHAVLTVSIWITTATTIAKRNVQIAVQRAEREHPAVMVRIRLRDRQKLFFGIKRNRVRRSVPTKSRNDRTSRIRRTVMYVDISVRRKIGVKRESQQTLFVVSAAEQNDIG